MFSSCISGVAFAILPLLVSSAAIEARSTSNNTVYLSDCQDSNGYQTSQMDFYSDYANSRSGQQPDANVTIPCNGTNAWEGPFTVGTFPDGTIFNSSGLDGSVAVGAQAGSGQLNQSLFYCYRDDSEALFIFNGVTCNRLFACIRVPTTTDPEPEKPPVDGTFTNVELSQSVYELRTGWDAYTKGFNGDQFGCPLDPYDLGNYCSIKFTCNFPDQVTKDAISAYMDSLASQIKVQNVHIDPKPICGGSCPVTDIGPGCCQTPAEDYQVKVFPRDLELTVNNIVNLVPSVRASLSATITCQPPPKCDASTLNLCYGIASVGGVIPLPGAGIIGLSAHYGCQQGC